MSRLSIRQLITEDLGYCCPYYFFRLFRQTATIADRLGVSPSTVRLAKARVDDGQDCCEACPNCLQKKLTLSGKPRAERPSS